MNNFFSNNFMNGFEMAEKGMEQYFKLCMTTVENMTTGQKQMESFFQNYMENPMEKSMSAMNTLNDFITQANMNQQHYQSIWTDYMTQMFDFSCKPRYNLFTGFFNN